VAQLSVRKFAPNYELATHRQMVTACSVIGSLALYGCGDD